MSALPKTLERKGSPALSLKEIVRPVLPLLDEVENRLNLIGQESDGILKESSRYVLCGSGKRLRAALTLFCASASGENGGRHNEKSRAVDIAVAVELIHAATLVHDDIVDRAVLRRLKPTVNVRFGEEVAVLLGDFLYARAFEIVAGAQDTQITAMISDTTRQMCEGELDQLKHRFRADLTMQEYISFIERKTASLIAVCAASGGRLSGLTSVRVNALSQFGMNIGIAYQIVDDLLDVVGTEDRMGKTLRTDAGNGKMTLPLILLVSQTSGAARKALLENLKSAEPDWSLIHGLVSKHNIAAQTDKFADDYFKKAVDSLKGFSPSLVSALENLSKFVLKRDY